MKSFAANVKWNERISCIETLKLVLFYFSFHSLLSISHMWCLIARKTVREVSWYPWSQQLRDFNVFIRLKTYLFLHFILQRIPPAYSLNSIMSLSSLAPNTTRYDKRFKRSYFFFFITLSTDFHLHGNKNHLRIVNNLGWISSFFEFLSWKVVFCVKSFISVEWWACNQIKRGFKSIIIIKL